MSDPYAFQRGQRTADKLATEAYQPAKFRCRRCRCAMTGTFYVRNDGTCGVCLSRAGLSIKREDRRP